MTKKSKEVAVDVALEPVEVVGLANKLVVQEGLGLEDVPFLNGTKSEARRPYMNNPNHEPIVEIAGKQFETKDIELKDIPAKIGSFISHHTPEDENVLCPRFQNHRSYNNVGRWRPAHQTLLRSDLKFKHLQVDNTDIYISTGSSLIITDAIDSLSFLASSAPATSDDKNILVIIASSVTAKSLTFAGTTILFNSVVEGDYVTLIDSTIDRSSISGSTGNVSIDDSDITDSNLYVSQYATVTDTRVTGLRITGVMSLTLDRVKSSGDFLFSTYGDSGNRLDLNISNQYLHKYEGNGQYIQEFKGYTPEVDYPIYRNGNTLNIRRRIDYGVFSAVTPVSFIRLNQYDLLVDNVAFSVKDFFPEVINTTEQSPKPFESSSPFGPFSPTPMAYTSSFGGGIHNRNSDVWKRASKIVFGANKSVIGKSGEALINSLLDQIKSRIGLYVEIYSLGDD